MFFPMLISFIISSILFNFSSLEVRQPFFDSFNFSTSNLNGRILGASEFAQSSLNTGEIGQVVEQAINASLATEEKSDSLPEASEKVVLIEYDLQAASGAALNGQDDNFIFTKEADQVRSIASVTKLMTAIIFLENNPGWDLVYQIRREDRYEGDKIDLYLGEKVKTKDLFYSSLVSSGNTATFALAHSTGMTSQEFIEKMNQKAVELGLEKTYFSDPVGLSNKNVSTAEEVALLAEAAFANEEIRAATLVEKYQFKTLEGKLKTAMTTDDLLKNFPQNGIKIIGGKTGYTEMAGYCFVAGFVDEAGKEIITVVLGADSSSARFSQTKNLAETIFLQLE